MQIGQEPLPAEMLVKDADQALGKMGRNAWPVGDSKRLHGMVTLREIEEASQWLQLGELVPADAMFPYVHPDHPLSLALERMGAHAVDTCPVVSRANIRQPYGVVTLTDVLTAFGVGKEVTGTKDGRAR
jgi:CBS domain-containing protein